MRRRQWKQEDLEKALRAVQEDGKSVRTAAALHGVPHTTVHYYASGKAQLGARPGPSTILSAAEEKELETWAIKMSEIGYGQTRRQVCEMVKVMLDRTNRTSPFPDNRPGKDWWYGFLRRHPRVSLKTPQPLQASRARSCTPQALDKWFSDYEQFLLKHELIDQPMLIWNCDESGFPLCPKSGKVLASTESKHLYQVKIATWSLDRYIVMCAVHELEAKLKT